MSKRKTMLASDIAIDHGDRIKDMYDKGASVTRLVKEIGCSRNTMNVVLGKLGYNVPKWMNKDS